MPPRLSLRLLGGFEATVDGSPTAPFGKKAQALLAYLALEGRAQHSRNELGALLWGDNGDEQAQQSLRKALSALRQALGPDAGFLVVQEGTVGLDRTRIDVDVLEFEKLAREKDALLLRKAAALYRGPCLAGLEVAQEPFNEWLLPRRERLRQTALNVMDRLLEQQEGSQETDAAIETASRLLELEPLHEPAHRALIRIYGRQGRRAAAARQYQFCVELLERELGVKPEAATEAAYRDSLEVESPATPSASPEAAMHTSAPAIQGATSTPVAEASSTRNPPPVVAVRPASESSRMMTVGVILALLVVSLGFAWTWLKKTTDDEARTSSSQAREAVSLPPPRRSIAIMPMKNLSNERSQAWLSTALTEIIGAELAAGGQFRLVDTHSMAPRTPEASPSGAGLTRKQLDQIGRELGCDLVLTGDYLAIGGKVRLDVRLDDTATGEAVARVSASDDEANLLALLDRTGEGLRAGLHVPRPGKLERDAIRATFPQSAGARRAYFSGLDALRKRDGPKAADWLQQAIKADPQLALAHSALSSTWRLLGYDGRGAEEAKRAMELSGSLSVEDRMNVEAQYGEAVSDWNKAIDGYGRLWRTHPDNIEYGLKLANVLQIATRLKEAQSVIAQMSRLPSPDGEDPRIDLVDATVAERLNDYPRAMAASARAAEKARASGATLLLARALIKQGIQFSRQSSPLKGLAAFEESEKLFDSLGDRGGVADAIRWQGAALLQLARLDEVRARLDSALVLSEPLHYVRLTTEIRLLLAELGRQKGAITAARGSAEKALVSARESGEESTVARATLMLGLLLKLQGDTDGARLLYDESVAISRRLSDSSNEAQALNNLAVLDLGQGRVREARASFEGLLATDRKIGNKSRIAARVQNLSQARGLQGDLEPAIALNTEECRLRTELGVKAAVAGCRTRLALLWVAQGRLDLAREAASSIEFADLKSSAQPPTDLARFATLSLLVGRRSDASTALAEADRQLAERQYIPEQALAVQIARARLDAASGRRAQALLNLDRAVTEADRFGFVPLSLEAGWLAATLRALAGTRDGAAQIESEAKSKGLAGVLMKSEPLR